MEPINPTNILKEGGENERKRRMPIYETIRLNSLFDMSEGKKIDDFFKNFPADPKAEDEFIQTLNEAVAELGSGDFQKQVIDATGGKNREIIAAKEGELKKRYPDQQTAVEVAMKLSFNPNGFPMTSGKRKALLIVDFLKSSEAGYQDEFNQEKQLDVASYYGMGGEPGGSLLKLNGEKLINYGEVDGGTPEDMQKLAAVIDRLIGWNGINQRMIADEFKKVQADKEKRAQLLDILKTSDSLGVAIFITELLNKTPKSE